jgi:general secretion pathway protein I
MRARFAGFTLLEVMVALVIVALGMMAVHKMLGDYAITAAEIEERTLASWVATNKLTELAVGSTWPPLGDSDEDVEFADRQWRCEIAVSETQVTNLRRVDVSVRLLSNPERVVRKVSALIEPPAPPGFLPPQWSAPPSGPGGLRDRGERG